MADLLSVIFEVIEITLYVGSQLVYALCTLVSVNYDLISTALEVGERLVFTIKALIHGTAVAFLDVAQYIVELTTRFAYFLIWIYNGSTGTAEAAYEIARFLWSTTYSSVTYTLSSAVVLSQWIVENSQSTAKMVVDSAPILMTKVSELVDTTTEKAIDIIQYSVSHVQNACTSTFIYVEKSLNFASSLTSDAVNSFVFPVVDFCREVPTKLEHTIKDVGELIERIQNQVFMLVIALTVSTVFVMSYSYIIILFKAFSVFLINVIQIIGSKLRNLASQLNTVPERRHVNNLPRQYANDGEGESGNESDFPSDQSERSVYDNNQSDDSDNQSETSSTESQHRTIRDWLPNHNFTTGHPSREVGRRNLNTFGIYDDGDNVNRAGPSGYNLRSRNSVSRTPERSASPGRAVRTLKRELEEERDRRLCVICQDNEKNVLVLPCKHMCMCEECADEIMHDEYIDRRLCPLCRTRITRVIDVFI